MGGFLVLIQLFGILSMNMVSACRGQLVAADVVDGRERPVSWVVEVGASSLAWMTVVRVG